MQLFIRIKLLPTLYRYLPTYYKLHIYYKLPWKSSNSSIPFILKTYCNAQDNFWYLQLYWVNRKSVWTTSLSKCPPPLYFFFKVQVYFIASLICVCRGTQDRCEGQRTPYSCRLSPPTRESGLCQAFLTSEIPCHSLKYRFKWDW